MSLLTTVADQVGETSTSSTGEEVLFWIIAPLAVLGGFGLIISRKAVHGAMFLAVTMVGLAILYIAQEAPFLGVVQIVVYTGAIMMLFLFVIMLVGVDASDSRVETIRGQRAAAALAVVGVVILLVTVAGRASLPEPTGTAEAAPEGNVYAIADLLFGRYVWAFEVVAAVLITAALGAMALTHRERIFRRPSQQELSEQRFREGDPRNAAGPPVPGVYARHNAVDTPALLPDGTPAEDSVSSVLVARGVARPTEEFTEDVDQLDTDRDYARDAGRPAGGSIADTAADEAAGEPSAGADVDPATGDGGESR